MGECSSKVTRPNGSHSEILVSNPTSLLLITVFAKCKKGVKTICILVEGNFFLFFLFDTCILIFYPIT